MMIYDISSGGNTSNMSDSKSALFHLLLPGRIVSPIDEVTLSAAKVLRTPFGKAKIMLMTTVLGFKCHRGK